MGTAPSKPRMQSSQEGNNNSQEPPLPAESSSLGQDEEISEKSQSTEELEADSSSSSSKASLSPVEEKSEEVDTGSSNDGNGEGGEEAEASIEAVPTREEDDCEKQTEGLEEKLLAPGSSVPDVEEISKSRSPSWTPENTRVQKIAVAPCAMDAVLRMRTEEEPLGPVRHGRLGLEALDVRQQLTQEGLLTAPLPHPSLYAVRELRLSGIAKVNPVLQRQSVRRNDMLDPLPLGFLPPLRRGRGARLSCLPPHPTLAVPKGMSKLCTDAPHFPLGGQAELATKTKSRKDAPKESDKTSPTALGSVLDDLREAARTPDRPADHRKEVKVIPRAQGSVHIPNSEARAAARDKGDREMRLEELDGGGRTGDPRAAGRRPCPWRLPYPDPPTPRDCTGAGFLPLWKGSLVSRESEPFAQRRRCQATEGRSRVGAIGDGSPGTKVATEVGDGDLEEGVGRMAARLRGRQKAAQGWSQAASPEAGDGPPGAASRGESDGGGDDAGDDAGDVVERLSR